MKISIVTICFNAAGTLEKALQSVRDQSHPDVEHIIVDGGSTDGTRDIILKHAGSLGDWCSEPDKGISDAFNKGLARCTGEVVGFLNADDWYEKDSLATVANAFINASADVIYGNVQLWEGGKPGVVVHADASALTSEMTLNHQAVFISRDTLSRLGGFRDDFHLAMDYELLLRAVRAGVHFHYLDKTLAHMQGGGVSRQQWARLIFEFYRAKQMHFPSMGNPFWLLFQWIKGSVSAFLNKMGLEGPVNFYHRHISRVKKVKSP